MMVLIEGDAITDMICRDGGYEPHFSAIAKSVIKPGDTVLDLGANCGFHTITMANLVGASGKVYSYEPQRFIFQQLNCNLFINNIQNVYSYNAAVGDENKLISITPPDYNQKGNIGDTHIEMNSEIGSEKIPMVVLDGKNLNNVKFIKIDIQGCELHALRGLRNTILRCRPIIFIELEDFQLIRYGTTLEMIHSYFNNELHYTIHSIRSDVKNNIISTSDCLCIPNEIDFKSLGLPGYEAKA
jgi:FkbM family methyltransferase